MRTHHRFILASLVAPIVAALAVTPAHAQTSMSSAPWNGGVGPLTLEGYYSHYRLDTQGDDRVGMNGLGGRLMWHPALGSVEITTRPSRAAVGLFAEYAPTQNKGFSMLNAGVQGYLNVLPTPLFGRVAPVASLGAGVLRTDVKNSSEAAETGFSLGTRNTTALSLAPSLGARAAVWRQVGVRADARDLVTFRDGTRHNLQFTAGISSPF